MSSKDGKQAQGTESTWNSTETNEGTKTKDLKHLEQHGNKRKKTTHSQQKSNIRTTEHSIEDPVTFKHFLPGTSCDTLASH
jgi:hypothetical protein